MKTRINYGFSGLRKYCWLIIWACAIGINPVVADVYESAQDHPEKYLICRGLVTDAVTGEPLSMASVSVEGTNMATIANSEGEFLFKVPESLKSHRLKVTYLGYQNEWILLSDFGTGTKRIPMRTSDVNLLEVNVVRQDAEKLMRDVFGKIKNNYVTEPTQMTAFYRETVKKNKSYVSLLEAVVDIFRYPVQSKREDVASLYKVRKQTDYTKLDTLVLKLAGGPYNTLCLDIMKNIDYTFSPNTFEDFDFRFDTTTMMDNHPVYVIDFKQKPSVTEPLYYGKLYVDATNMAMFSASFDLNLDNPSWATQLFILHKPASANIVLTKAHYHVNYLLRDGKWYLSYGRSEMDWRVSWKRKLFRSNYETVFEMAVTDWKPSDGKEWSRTHDKLRPEAVVAEEVHGFIDSEFWGDDNIIEPDKSIETAVNKIQKRLNKR